MRLILLSSSVGLFVFHLCQIDPLTGKPIELYPIGPLHREPETEQREAVTPRERRRSSPKKPPTEESVESFWHEFAKSPSYNLTGERPTSQQPDQVVESPASTAADEKGIGRHRRRGSLVSPQPYSGPIFNRPCRRRTLPRGRDCWYGKLYDADGNELWRPPGALFMKRRTFDTKPDKKSLTPTVYPAERCAQLRKEITRTIIITPLAINIVTARRIYTVYTALAGLVFNNKRLLYFVLHCYYARFWAQ